MMRVEHGRPSDPTGRAPQELAVYDLLDRLEISYERVDHAAAFTMQDCEAIDRVLAPAAVCKNLFLCNAQKSDFYLLMLRADKKLKTKVLSAQIGSARLSFAPEEHLPALLGLIPGSVSVLGLMNDRAGRVRLLIDQDLLSSEWVGCHPCVNTASLRLRIVDLLECFLPAVGHDYRTVQL